MLFERLSLMTIQLAVTVMPDAMMSYGLLTNQFNKPSSGSMYVKLCFHNSGVQHTLEFSAVSPKYQAVY
jgi:hypothetical protein